MSKTCTLFIQPFLDTSDCQRSYKNVVSISSFPAGPLGTLVQRAQFMPLSPFSSFVEPCKRCGLAIRTIYPRCGSSFPWMIEDDLPELITYLGENGYAVDNKLTSTLIKGNIRIDANIGKRLLFIITFTG